MGQRHQVFLIARIVPDGKPSKARYRCIAALHHQWTYGCLALKAVTRFMALVKQRDNSEIIQDEIRSANELYGSLEPQQKLPRVLCPYLQFLACVAWCVNFSGEPYEAMYAPDSIILPASMASFDGDNNDGITIIDLTILESPSYCYVKFSRPKSINARQYIQAQVQSALRPLESLPLISTDVLEEVWPSDYRTVQKRGRVPSSVMPAGVDADLAAFDIDKILSEPFDIVRLKKYLLAQDRIEDNLLHLFNKIIELETKNDQVVDLSQYRLRHEQISKILSSHTNVEVLKLSHNKAVSMAFVQQLSPTLPRLRRLVVLNTSITKDEVRTAFCDNPKLFHGLEAFIHPAFNSFYPGAPESPPIAFTHVTLDSSQRDIDAVSLSYFTTPQVLQGLIDYLSPLLDDENGVTFVTCIRLCRYSLKAAYASELRKEGQPWGDRISFRRSQPIWILPDHKSVVDELRQEIKALRAEKSLSEEERSAKEVVIHASYSTKVGTVYDLHGFLEQLELEGREPPSSEQVARMEEIFAGMEKGQEFYQPFSKLTSEDLPGAVLDSDTALEWRRRYYQYQHCEPAWN
ncbi:unnamed protein product [Cyclocybe aegerita]|uniref:Uncharacterized protein n=1 Tax=Cyclocybe aegerita TaxID=1973307 RepID=A0A8S0WKK0_CYCAE|nr:unnamed protein product [Cyclocybe aegerita]